MVWTIRDEMESKLAGGTFGETSDARYHAGKAGKRFILVTPNQRVRIYDTAELLVTVMLEISKEWVWNDKSN